MTDLPNPAIGGVGGLDDLGANAAFAAAVIAFSTALSAASFPAPTAVTVVEAVAVAVDVTNLRSPSPFQEAAEKWGEVAEALHTFATETEAKVRACGDDAWDGPSADAFREYVRGKLLPGAEKFAEAAEHIKESCEKTVKSLVFLGFVPYAATTVAATFVAIGTLALEGIPDVGEALREAILMPLHLSWAGTQLAAIVGLFLAEMSLRANEFAEQVQLIRELKELLASGGE
jgi:hypothetical protein